MSVRFYSLKNILNFSGTYFCKKIILMDQSVLVFIHRSKYTRFLDSVVFFSIIKEGINNQCLNMA